MTKKQKSKKAKLCKHLFSYFLVFLFFAPVALAAAEPAAYPDIKINIGGFSGQEFKTQNVGWQSAACPDKTSKNCLSLYWIGQYITVIYRYGVGLAAVLAAIMISVGGFLWLSSAGNPSQISKGQEFMISALTGLILALFSFLILQTINPRLTALEPVTVAVPAEQEDVCCQNPDGSYSLHMVSKGNCSALGEGYSDGGANCKKGPGNTLPLESKANPAVSQLILDCQQKTPQLNCETMIEIYDYQEFQGIYEYKLKGNEDLATFLITQGQPSPIKPELLERQGIAAQVTYGGAVYTLYGDKPGERYWQVIKLGNNLPGFD